ncbi:hypothetical protein F1654_12495 [Alkalicaulis satelles]|uniref:Uncharacterized protein n=1 Tax=Alkalicaulis satelles TaxID=2609175 RepID=A0A5M6ZF18_9PROT|nr:hypothetical protein [Alkalicaulis satelles]KAA5801698.1 hypothetical protein F1654_12495 [Alkalicaulis satelles]
MSARAIDFAALVLADPHTGRLALGRNDGSLIVPCVRPERGDGAGAAPALPRVWLGAAEIRSGAFQDAALRALFEYLGQLIARPAPADAVLARDGGWSRMARHGLMPDRAALRFLGRAIDPAHMPRRRHVRVFSAPLSAVSNSLKRRGWCERLVWLTPQSAGSLDDPSLEPFLAHALTDPDTAPVKVTFRAGQRLIQPLERDLT